ncbi:hypothetical protein WJX72_005213 [[Myrmecia] bisecta]|uniref:Aminoglycoside N(3)-acetyltransferase n=1 Tax=[Myrmecia] bisecta TaxID=41462 RepID=A0AAW1R728_9CHLO
MFLTKSVAQSLAGRCNKIDVQKDPHILGPTLSPRATKYAVRGNHVILLGIPRYTFTTVHDAVAPFVDYVAYRRPIHSRQSSYRRCLEAHGGNDGRAG